MARLMMLSVSGPANMSGKSVRMSNRMRSVRSPLSVVRCRLERTTGSRQIYSGSKKIDPLEGRHGGRCSIEAGSTILLFAIEVSIEKHCSTCLLSLDGAALVNHREKIKREV